MPGAQSIGANCASGSGDDRASCAETRTTRADSRTTRADSGTTRADSRTAGGKCQPN